METRQWYINHGYTEKDIAAIEKFHAIRDRRKEVRRTIANVCEKVGLLFFNHDGSINSDNVESINSAMSELRGKNIEPVRVSVSLCGSYQYSAFYNY